jgi:phosphoribosylanthranilate isomerase
MFRIKICGITNVDDALAAAAAGADAIGLNFYGQSKRFVDIAAAERISASLPGGVTKVGVFVNAVPNEIAAIADQLGLSWIQLHGDEPPQLLAQLPRSVSIIRAHRCGTHGLAPLQKYLADCQFHGRAPQAVLIDADAGGEFGGTGRTADWQRIASARDLLAKLPLVLGGGLTPANVAAAIMTVRPDGVDVASGVERTAGRKDAGLVQKFVTAAAEAFARI